MRFLPSFPYATNSANTIHLRRTGFFLLKPTTVVRPSLHTAPQCAQHHLRRALARKFAPRASGHSARLSRSSAPPAPSAASSEDVSTFEHDDAGFIPFFQGLMNRVETGLREHCDILVDAHRRSVRGRAVRPRLDSEDDACRGIHRLSRANRSMLGLR